MNCRALGCKKHAVSRARPFCKKHWGKLPVNLQAKFALGAVPSAVAECVVVLGQQDGYLVDVPPRPVKLLDVKGSEYV